MIVFLLSDDEEKDLESVLVIGVEDFILDSLGDELRENVVEEMLVNIRS